MLKIAEGKSIYSDRLTLHEYTVSQLFRKLKKPDIRTKKDGPTFLFAEFVNLQNAQAGEKIAHSLRRAENLLYYHGAVIDLDDVALTLDDIFSRLPKVKFFIHTTYSHQLEEKYHPKGYPPANRYRVIVPYCTPVKPENHKLILLKIKKTLGEKGVDQCSFSVSQAMYWPSTHPSNRRNFDYRVRLNAPLFSSELTPEERYEFQDALENEKPAEQPRPVDINEEIYEGQGRNVAATRIVGKLITSGMDQDTLRRAVRAWNIANCKPPLSKKELDRTINSIAQRHDRTGGQWGFDEIKRRIVDASEDELERLIKQVASADPKTISPARKELLTRELHKQFKLPLGILREEIKNAELICEEVETDESEKRERKTVQELRDDFREWIYIASIDRVYNSKNGIVYKTEGFNRMHQSKLDRGTVLPLLLKYDCLRQADRMDFAPGEKLIFTHNNIVYANTYRTPTTQPRYANPKIMLDHFRKLIPEQNEREIILDYIAFLVQHPGKKILWMPIIKGGKGIGKSIIPEKILSVILGEQNVRSVKSRKVKADFNAWQLDTQLVVFHELKIGTTRAEKLHLTEELKELITDHGMQASRKGVDDYDVRNKLNVFGLTNHEDAILISADERRFFLIRSELKMQPKEYYDQLHDWLDANPEGVMHYFKNRDISDFNPHFLPESKYTQEVKNNSYLWPQSVLAAALCNINSTFNTAPAVTWTYICEYLKMHSAGRDALECENLVHPWSSQSYKLINALKDSGFRKYENRRGNSRARIAGKLQTVWLTPTGVDLHAQQKLRRQMIMASIKKQSEVLDFEN